MVRCKHYFSSWLVDHKGKTGVVYKIRKTPDCLCDEDGDCICSVDFYEYGKENYHSDHLELVEKGCPYKAILNRYGICRLNRETN